MEEQLTQLIDLANARSELQGGTPYEHFERFQDHFGTEEACPRGHPEIALAINMARKKEIVISETYQCPACFQAPFEFFD